MQAIFNSFMTSKIEHREFAQAILALRRDLEDEITRLIEYKTIGVWGTGTLVKRTDEAISRYDRQFLDTFDALEFSDKVELIAKWKDFAKLAEDGKFQDSVILLAAARIVK